LSREGDFMRIADHLSKEKKRKLDRMVKKERKIKRKEWEEIMGTKRDIYKRVNGAVRRK
jgi:flagellar motor switch protein FliG